MYDENLNKKKIYIVVDGVEREIDPVTGGVKLTKKEVEKLLKDYPNFRM